MTKQDLEGRLAALEATTRQLQQRLDRAADYIAIQNLASRYQFYHQPSTMARSFELFAQQTPGVSVAISGGVEEGLDRVKAFWTKTSPFPPVGVMLEHQLTTPLIEVAEDGLTAKAVWMSPGHETVPGLLPGGHWAWGRYAIDFVKEDGAWKIWHLRYYPTIRVRCGQDWADGPEPPSDALVRHRAGQQPSRPLADDSIYRPDAVRTLHPPLPEPYRSFQDLPVAGHGDDA